MYRISVMDLHNPNCYMQFGGSQKNDSKLKYVETYKQARKNIRLMCGVTRDKSDVFMPPELIERRRNKRFIVEIWDIGDNI